MTPAPGEEWLSKQEPVLRGWLSKAILSFLAIGGPLLLILSEAQILLKLAGSAVWILLMLSLWLLSWLAIYRTKVRSLEAERAETSNNEGAVDDPISKFEYSLLELMYDYYSERYTKKELQQKSGAPEVELDLALLNLINRKPPFVVGPRGGLWREGRPNPKGFGLTKNGMAAVKNQRSE